MALISIGMLGAACDDDDAAPLSFHCEGHIVCDGIETFNESDVCSTQEDSDQLESVYSASCEDLTCAVCSSTMSCELAGDNCA